MNQPQSMPVTPKKSMAWLWIIIVIILLASGGYLGYYYWNQSQAKTATPTTATIPDTLPAGQSPLGGATADWKTYTNTDLGFSFKYPSNASLSEPAIKKSLGLVYDVDINNLSTMEDGPMGYDKVTALKDKAALASNDPSTSFGQAIPDSLKMLSIKNALAKELTITRQLEVCDVQFDRQAIIYKDDYQIVLTWQYVGTDIQNNNPSYFETDSKNCGAQKIWRSSIASSFYADLVAGKTDAVSQNWFTDFDKIISTFQFSK